MSINALTDWLGIRFPFVYRLVRPPWRLFKRALYGPDYREQRKDLNYYKEVLRLGRAYVPQGKEVIDVGAGQTEYLRELYWFQRRVALDSRYVPPQRGVVNVMQDFMAFKPVQKYDLVLCLQVLEHLDRPEEFARKLFTLGSTVIISVPYKWPKGEYPPHVQDPVDEEQLFLRSKQNVHPTFVLSTMKVEADSQATY